MIQLPLKRKFKSLQLHPIEIFPVLSSSGLNLGSKVDIAAQALSNLISLNFNNRFDSFLIQ